MSAADLLAAALPFGLSVEDAIAALAGLSALLAASLVWRTLVRRDPVARRLAALAARRAALRAELAAGPPSRRRRERHLGRVRRVVAALNLLRSREAHKAARRLACAGRRGTDAVVIYFFAKLALPFAFGAAAVFAIYGLKLVALAPAARFAVAMGAVVLGAYAPDLWLRNAIAKRRQALQKGVPDALDLLVICAEAGQSLDGALNRVAGELARSCPELGEELGLAAIELGLLPERRQALDNLAARAGIPAIRSVVNTLIQTERYGTPLARSLRVLAAEYRNDRMMKAEEKAARLPVILTVPMIAFILPPLFIVLIGPAILRTVDLLARF